MHILFDILVTENIESQNTFQLHCLIYSDSLIKIDFILSVFFFLQKLPNMIIFIIDNLEISKTVPIESYWISSKTYN